MVTLLFSDLENSRSAWESDPEKMSREAARHGAIVRDVVARHGGTAVNLVGDGVHAVFAEAADAIRAATAIVGAFVESGGSGLPVAVRCGIHCGPAEESDRDHFGRTVHFATRLAGAAHGGQILASSAVAASLESRLPDGVSLVDVGEARLRGLSRPEKLFQISGAGLSAAFPAPRSHNLPPNNLPSARTAFIGREAAVQEVTSLLATNRLLTLLGPGGIGKTRLSLQAAGDTADSYVDGVWFVEFAALTDPGLVAQLVAQTIGLRETPGRSAQESLIEYLRARRLLLMFDNCEHLIDACARLADNILRASAGTVIVATSREPLQIEGETLYDVPGLALPVEGKHEAIAEFAKVEAVALFADRARHAQHRFYVDGENAGAIASIVRRLDGIPLAIELAAARLRGMSVEEIERGLDDRFRLLTGGSRVALPRQQTLRALIDWSYNLLATEERLLFDRLAVFSGGWLEQAAEDICAGTFVARGDIPALLVRLAEKSLIKPDSRSPASRYIQLETIREFAREHFIENGMDRELDGRHAEWCLRFAQSALDNLHGGTIKPVYDRFELEHDNLRAAIAWFLGRSQVPANALLLASALTHFWVTRGYANEGRAVFASALAHPGAAGDKRALALAEERTGKLAYVQADTNSAIAYSKRALERYRELCDAPGIARSLCGLAMAVFVRDGDAASRPLFEEAIAACLASGLTYEAGNQLGNLSMNALYAGDLAFAERSAQRMRELNSVLKDPRLAGYDDKFLAVAALNTGRPQDALEPIRRSIESSRAIGDRNFESMSLVHLGRALLALGHLDDAQQAHHRAIDILHKAMLRLELMNALEAYAGVLARGGMAEHAAALCAATEAERLRLDYKPGAAALASRQTALESARQQCEKAVLERALVVGAGMSLESAVAVALTFDVSHPHDSPFARVAERLTAHGGAMLPRGNAIYPALASMESVLAPANQLTSDRRKSLVEELAARGEHGSYPKNAIVAAQGEVSGDVIVLLEGRVRIFATHHDDKQVVIEEYGPGDYLGELALDESPRAASMMALTACRISRVQRAEVVDFIRVHPGFALDMIFKLAQRARSATENIKGLAFLNVYGRVARLLNTLAEADGGARALNPAPTQAEIAQRVGATREMVNMIMRDLTTGGYIRKDGRELAILKKLPERW